MLGCHLLCPGLTSERKGGALKALAGRSNERVLESTSSSISVIRFRVRKTGGTQPATTPENVSGLVWIVDRSQLRRGNLRRITRELPKAQELASAQPGPVHDTFLPSSTSVWGMKSNHVTEIHMGLTKHESGQRESKPRLAHGCFPAWP